MKKIKLLLFVIALFGQQVISAQKIGGGEIYYKQFARYKFEVTAIVYRKCNDAGLTQLDAKVISDSFDYQMNLKRISIKRINDTCGNPCNIINSKGNFGYERHEFIDTVDFTKSPYDNIVKKSNCTVRFAIHQFLRDSGFTTFQKSQFYLEAKVNLCHDITSNHSPRFSMEPKFMYCCNQPFTYNAGFMDTFDFDSLSISLESPMKDMVNTVTYTGGFNKSIPMTPYCPPNPGNLTCKALPYAKPARGFYFDPLTGDIVATPTKCDEVSALRFKVSEFRKDSSGKFILIGEVNREMQVRVYQCPDNYMTKLFADNDVSVCDQNKICVTNSSEDYQFLPKQTTPDTTTLFWDYGIPSATFNLKDSNAREKTATFCWESNKVSKNGIFRYTIAAYDKKCNIGLISKGIVVHKNPNAQFNKQIWKDNCSVMHYKIEPKDSVYQNNHTYSVSIADHDNPGFGIFYSSKPNDSFMAPSNSRYLIRTTVNNSYNCPVMEYDTMTLSTSMVNLSNQAYELHCMGDSLTLKPINDNFDAFHFDWYDNDIGNQVADTGKTYKIVIKGMKRRIKLKISPFNGCLLSDSLDIFSRGAFTFDPEQHDKTVCKGLDTLQIKDIKATPPTFIYWTSEGQTLSNSNSCIINVKKDMIVKVRVMDGSGCSTEDSMNINVSNLPEIIMNDTVACVNENIKIRPILNPHLSNLSYEWIVDGVVSGQSKNTYDLRVAKDHILKLIVTDSNGCTGEKSVQIDALPLPEFTILTDTIYNKAHFIHLSTDKAYDSYNWFNGVQTRDNNFWAYTLGAPGKYSIWCEVTDGNGCKNRQQLGIETNGKTSLEEFYENGIVIYPNPVENILYLSSEGIGEYAIYTMEGKILKQGAICQTTLQISVEDLSSGVYLIAIKGKFYKFVKS